MIHCPAAPVLRSSIPPGPASMTVPPGKAPHALDRSGVAEKPRGSGEHHPGAGIRPRIQAQEQDQRAWPVGPRSDPTRLRLIDASGPKSVVRSRPDGRSRQSRTARAIGAFSLRLASLWVGEKRAGECQRRFIQRLLPSDSLPARRDVGGCNRQPRIACEVRPAAERLGVADRRDCCEAVLLATNGERVVHERRVVATNSSQALVRTGFHRDRSARSSRSTSGRCSHPCGREASRAGARVKRLHPRVGGEERSSTPFLA